MSEKETSPQSTWARAVETLANMCISDQIGRGPTREAFILTLRFYADEMEKLITPTLAQQGGEQS